MGCGRSTKIIPELRMSKEIKEICNIFQFTDKEIQKLWQIFHKMDDDGTGTLSLVEIFVLLKEQPNSVIAPYLREYISSLKKDEGDRLSFVEFVRCISKYCLLNPTQILKFVFQCIDENRSGVITKEEVMLFLRTECDGKRIFPNNYMKAVELFETERSDQIKWGEFVRLVREVPYLSFPAFRLQNSLSDNTLGASGWNRVRKRMMNKKAMDDEDDDREKEREHEKRQRIWNMQIAAADRSEEHSQRSWFESKRFKKKPASVISV